MFRVDEYYSTGKTCAKMTRHLQRLDTLEEAKTLADSAYREVSQIPESEAVWIGVIDETRGRLVYSQPDEPLPKLHK